MFASHHFSYQSKEIPDPLSQHIHSYELHKPLYQSRVQQHVPERSTQACHKMMLLGRAHFE
uniref:Uncharacterized protein n=1 Tax=Arundo donax TaxID=35708 RepID=A0A0A9DX88_ARUDO